jgi:hypothetical protein
VFQQGLLTPPVYRLNHISEASFQVPMVALRSAPMTEEYAALYVNVKFEHIVRLISNRWTEWADTSHGMLIDESWL